MKRITLTILATFTIFLTACANNPFVAPTQTSTSTPEPTQTPLPTITPTPTFTPTSEPTIAVGKTIEIPDGNFSFQEPMGYDVEINGGQVGVFDKEGTIIISIYGGLYNSSDNSLDEVLEQFVSEVFKRGDGDYTKSGSYPIFIDGIEGIAYDISGSLFGSPLKGQAIIVAPNKDQYLFGLGVANTSQDKKRWENKGAVVFGDLINSIKFLSVEQSNSSGNCKISTDQSYGYSPENPIKVGGDAFEGPSRERAFLDNLLGPNGEKLSYERKGSMSFGDTILDEFAITGSGINATLYIDEYTFSEPQAPFGFICESEFSLTKP